MVAEKETFQESFPGARDTKMVIKRKAPLHRPSFGKQCFSELGISTHLLSQVIFFFSFFPQGAVKYKKQVRFDCNCFCY